MAKGERKRRNDLPWVSYVHTNSGFGAVQTLLVDHSACSLLTIHLPLCARRLGYGLGFSRLFLEIVFKDWCDTDGSGFFGLYICANYLCE